MCVFLYVWHFLLKEGFNIYVCGVFSLILRVGTSRTTIYTFWITMSGFLIERIANVIVWVAIYPNLLVSMWLCVCVWLVVILEYARNYLGYIHSFLRSEHIQSIRKLLLLLSLSFRSSFYKDRIKLYMTQVDPACQLVFFFLRYQRTEANFCTTLP